MGLSDEEEAVVSETFPELLTMGDFDLKNLKKLQRSSCNTTGVDNPKKLGKPNTTTGDKEKPRLREAIKEKQDIIYPNQFDKIKEGNIIVDTTPALEE